MEMKVANLRPRKSTRSIDLLDFWPLPK
jgi:hypothetical protein